MRTRSGAILVCVIVAACALPARAAANPNILIFLTDDQRADYTMAMMPTASHYFGDGGTRFSRAYVTTPLCCPSRASIFSGRYAHNTGVTTLDAASFDARDTWQRYLHAHGYYTGLIGKYLNGVPTEDAPYFDYTDAATDYGPGEIAGITASASTFFDRAAERDQPWVLVVATYSPHDPWDNEPTQPLAIPPYDPLPSHLEADRSDKPTFVRWRYPTDTGVATSHEGQMTEVQAADEELRNVLQIIRSHRLGGNLLSFFLSDNGYLWGEHGLMAKRWPYRESVQVPFYMRWPGHVAAGAVDNRLVANIDIAPTIFQATSVAPGYTVDGQSLLGGLARRWLLLEWPAAGYLGMPLWRSYVGTNSQYIEWGNGWREFYDLRTDPWEMEAINAGIPVLHSKLASAANCAGASCP